MDNKVLVYTTKQSHMAHLIEGALEADGIKAVLLDQKDSATSVIGNYEIYVAPQNEARAKEIIAQGQ